jgi:hypothetical protein
MNITAEVQSGAEIAEEVYRFLSDTLRLLLCDSAVEKPLANNAAEIRSLPCLIP